MANPALLDYSYPRTKEDELKTKNVWLKGHTGKTASHSLLTPWLLNSSINIDFGTVTILYSQPVAGLQILAKDSSWKWVKHVENALVRTTILEGSITKFIRFIGCQRGGRPFIPLWRLLQSYRSQVCLVFKLPPLIVQFSWLNPP